MRTHPHSADEDKPREVDKICIRTSSLRKRDLPLIAIFAAIYAALVWVLAPISFYALQFRVAGVLRPAIAKKWTLSIGYAMGVVVANLTSPFVGLHELLFMPFMSFIAGILGYWVASKFNQNYFVAGVVIAMIIPIGVSWMLLQLFSLPVIVTFPMLLVSEQLTCFIGACVFEAIEKRYVWWT